MIQFLDEGVLKSVKEIRYKKDDEIYAIKNILVKENGIVKSLYGIAPKLDYIKSGMFLWWDGHANFNQTHSNTTDLWTDISGNGNHGKLFKLGDMLDWTDNALNCYADTTRSRYAATEDRIFMPDTITMEVCISDMYMVTNSWKPLVHDWGSNNIAGYWMGFTGSMTTVNKPTFSFFFATSYSNRIDIVTDKQYKTYSITYNAATKRVVVYGDGIQLYNAVSGLNNFGAHMGRVKIFNSSPPDEQSVGKMHSVRLYNRVLSASEVMQNHQADLVRYFN